MTTPEVKAAMLAGYERIVGEPVDELTFEVRCIMVNEIARIDQEMRQRRPMSPVDMRKAEWDAAKKIVALVRGERA